MRVRWGRWNPLRRSPQKQRGRAGSCARSSSAAPRCFLAQARESGSCCSPQEAPLKQEEEDEDVLLLVASTRSSSARSTKLATMKINQ